MSNKIDFLTYAHIYLLNDSEASTTDNTYFYAFINIDAVNRKTYSLNTLISHRIHVQKVQVVSAASTKAA